MVDVGQKEISVREATASGRVETTADVLAALRAGTIPKGDVVAAARLAGIMAVKRTPDLIPLCHPIGISGADVELDLTADSHVVIQASVRTADRTGVEMEALTAVAAAGLTVIDMVKGTDPAASIEGIKVLTKTGGKTGDWVRPSDR
ncbi:MAG TPA: cyclic pyranopterin monophosphate synthase MoaC [Actinobacteria bacterium]|nr:cyclic pyranopterin monophosphate synthase MoaC [Actinomycetota bacterium]